MSLSRKQVTIRYENQYSNEGSALMAQDETTISNKCQCIPGSGRDQTLDRPLPAKFATQISARMN